MSFSTWFKKWIRSFYRLCSVDRPIKRSERQKERYRLNRLKATQRPSKRYQVKRRRRRSSHTVQNERWIRAIFGFVATSLGIFLLPFGLLQWGYESRKQRKKKKATATPKAKRQSEDKRDERKSRVDPQKAKASQAEQLSQNDFFESEYKPHAFSAEDSSPSADANDESAPKSKPRNPTDQYVRKRMIVAGSYYCETEIVKALAVGSYLSLVPEPANPHDKNAILLLFEEQKIGYVAKKDQPPFVACFSLHRKPYGVITDILQDGEYEYEVWFER